MADDKNTTGVDNLSGPLHNSLRSFFSKYYTLSEKNNNTPEQAQAERRLQILDRITDRQEES